MSFSVFTSCTIADLPKARALADSLHQHQPDARVTLCLNDIVPEWLTLDDEPFHQVWLPGDLGYDPAWIFQHNTVELCTAVKGRALTRLLDEEDAELHLFLAPDVQVFHSLQPIGRAMDGLSIGLVPQIQQAAETDLGIRLTELSAAGHGVYDLGHLVVRGDKTGRAFATWWAERLDRYCFDDRTRGFFTDQRWADLVPAIFDAVGVLRMPNLNVSPMNQSARRIKQIRPGDPASFTIDGLPLITFRHRATHPTGTALHFHDLFQTKNCSGAEIERLCDAAVARNSVASVAEHTCGFDSFADGVAVSATARRLYRDHQDLQRAFPNPYAAGTPGLTYQRWLRMNRPGAIDGICLDPLRLEQAFDDLFDPDYYLAANPDVRAQIDAGRFASASDHYCRIGSALFMDPNEFFVSSFYHDRASGFDQHLLRHHAGAKQGTLLWHYLVSGLQNGIEPIEFFDSNFYLQHNPDVMTAFRLGQTSTPLAHFLRHGSKEGRDPGPDFNAKSYLDSNPRARELACARETRGGFGAFVRLGGVAGRIAA